MKKIIYIGIFIATVLMSTACENNIDNYDAPNGGIYGTILDKETNEPVPLPVQGSSGTMISLFELNTNATVSIDFRAKADGTYANKKVFNGDYRVMVTGPFAGVAEGFITIKGQTKLDIVAIPLARILIEASIDADNKITIHYDAQKADDALSLTDVSVMWNYAPGVDINSSNYASIVSKGTVAKGTHVFDLYNDPQFVENHYKILSNSNKVYVRVAATVNTLTNYSKVVELKVGDIK